MIAKHYKQNHNDLLFSLAHTASVAFALGTFATGLSPKSTLKSKPAMFMKRAMEFELVQALVGQ